MHEFADGGFTFDTGVHYVGRAEKYGKLMDMVSLPRRRVAWARLGSESDGYAYDCLRVGDLPPHALRAGEDRFVADLAKRWPAYEGRIRRYVALCKTSNKEADNYFFGKLFPRFIQKLVAPRLCRKFYGFASATVDEVIRGDCGIDDDDLVATLTGYAGNYGLAPSEASFFVHAGVASHYMGGAYVPVSGPQAIADALVATVNAYGGKVLMRAAVEKIVLNDAGRAISVQLEDDDKVILAKRGVVSAAGCLQTLKLLPEAARREVEWADAILNPASEDFVEQGISHLSLFVGFDTTAAELDLPSQNQWCVSGSGETAKAWHALPDGAAAAARGDLGTYFVGFPSAKDPSARASKPATCSIISETNEAWWRPWADSPPHKRPEAYEALKKAFEERMLAKLYELFPQCEGRVVFSKLGTSLTNDHYLKRAASYGLAPTPKRYASPKMAAIRPEVAEIPGLFITGQDVTTAGWAGALMSGVMTAMAILGYGFLDLAVFNRDLVTDLMRVTDAADQADKKAN